jgi:hypothetical protein
MNRSGHIRLLAAFAAFTLALSPAFAAAPDSLDPEPVLPRSAGAVPVIDYALGTEIVVQNWVLCVSRTVAEQLVHAREAGIGDARSAYDELKQARSCGQFPELRVILQERLYVSTAESGHDARVFGALVNFAGSWASAFVVYGGLPEE